MIELEQTADGSYTLFVPELNEHYHSVKGALTESEHIFINMGMKHHPSSTLRILEIGFGTGLNAFLTLLEADNSKRQVHYTTIERYPVSNDIVHQLAYPEQICPERSNDFYALHNCKSPVKYVFSATSSTSIFVPKNETYDDTRRSCRNYYVLQGTQSNL